MTKYQTEPSCLPGCRCFFRDLVADNLTYLEIAGEVANALYHLLPLINRQSMIQSDNSCSTMIAPNLSVTVVLNVGDGAFLECEDLLPCLLRNISLRLFHDWYGLTPSLEACFSEMHRVHVTYRSKREQWLIGRYLWKWWAFHAGISLGTHVHLFFHLFYYWRWNHVRHR